MPITIKAKNEGFRRCKRSWSKTPVTFADGVLSDEELKTLRAEKMLIVTEAPAESDSAKPDKKKR